eukprot:5002895-Alexandrium_andersonii.AAC.1
MRSLVRGLSCAFGRGARSISGLGVRLGARPLNFALARRTRDVRPRGAREWVRLRLLLRPRPASS